MDGPSALRFLERLGLGHLVALPVPLEPPPPAKTGRGFTGGAVLAEIARMAPESTPFARVEMPELAGTGFRLARYLDQPSIVKVSGPGRGLRVRIETESPYVVACDDSEAVLIDTDHAPPA